MGGWVRNYNDPLNAVVEIGTSDSKPALRIVHQGAGGNAIEVKRPDGTVLWSVDRAGTASGATSVAAPVTLAPDAINIALTLKPTSTTPPQDFLNITSSTGTKVLRMLYDLQETDPGGPAVVMTMEGGNGGWTVGIDAAAATPGRDFAIAKKGGWNASTPGTYFDTFYIEHNGTSPPSIQINNSSAFAPQGSLEVMMATDNNGNVHDTTASNLVIHTGVISGGTPNQTQPAIRMRNWTSGTDRFHLEADGSINLYDTGGNPNITLASLGTTSGTKGIWTVGSGSYGSSAHNLFVHAGAANTDISVQTTSGGSFQIQALNASGTVNAWTTNNSDLILGTNTTARLTIAKTTGGLTQAYSQTLAGATTDVSLATYTPVIAGAFTADRLNYAVLSQPTGAATITDAAVFRFDAAIGTHKAVDAGTTKTTPGTVTAWIKVNINGTIHYMPAYASKTT